MEYQKHVSHIMWQPTATCKLSCPGCYVPKMQLESASVDAKIALDVYSNKSVTCRQFTLSADDLTHFPNGLKTIVRGIWAKYPDSSLPDLCVTANSWNTVQCWARDLDMTVDQCLKPVSMLSLSTFPVLGKNISFMVEQCHANNTKVNFNYVVRGGEEQNKYFEMGVLYADQVYLVLKKPALGEPLPRQDLVNWMKARQYAKIYAGKKPEKIIEDQCVMDSMSYNDCGQCCSAHTSKSQVWPNGTMTGCPYDSHQTHGDICSCAIPVELKALKKELKIEADALENFGESASI
jgi:hypothetical protein